MIQKQTFVKIAIAVLVLVLFVFSLYLYLKKTSETTLEPKSGKVLIQTPEGPVETNNFFTDFVEQSGDILALVETKDFSIVYYKQDQVFNISLFSEPLSEALDKAENLFMNKLGIDNGQACRLKTIVRVPYSVNQQASGVEYGLSFCPNVRKLEF